MPRPKGSGHVANLRPSTPGHRGAGDSGAGRRKGSKNKLSVERVQTEIARIALSDPILLFTKAHGRQRTFTLREIDQMSPDIRACIASVKVKTENLTAGDDHQDTTVEVKLWDKIKALEMCARHFKWINDSVSGEDLAALVATLDAFKARNREKKQHD
jgi:hypothetical protein